MPLSDQLRWKPNERSVLRKIQDEMTRNTCQRGMGDTKRKRVSREPTGQMYESERMIQDTQNEPELKSQISQEDSYCSGQRRHNVV